jgi:hypothetical protein
MIERCIVCHLKFVEQEKAERFPQLCGNCMQKAELEAMKQGPRAPIARSEDMLAAAGADIQEKFRRGVSKQEKARDIPGDKFREE